MCVCVCVWNVMSFFSLVDKHLQNIVRDYHCGLIGYQPKKKDHVPIPEDVSYTPRGPKNVTLSKVFSTAGSTLPASGKILPPANASSNYFLGRHGQLKSNQRNFKGRRRMKFYNLGCGVWNMKIVVVFHLVKRFNSSLCRSRFEKKR